MLNIGRLRGGERVGVYRRQVSELRAIRTVRPKKPANLFLVEMIIAMLFFSVSGAVILNVFAAADGKMRRSETGDGAVLCAQSCAEVYSAAGSAEKMAEKVFGGFERAEDGTLRVALDERCRPAEGGAVELVIRESGESSAAGSLMTAELTFARDGEEIRRFVCSAYVPRAGKESGA